MIRAVTLDRRTLPKGSQFQVVGYEKRQVIDLDISRFVTEYQAEILENAQGQRFVAPFPDGVDRPVQYGPSVKAHAVYLSQYQLLPYERIREYFEDQAGIPLSAGSLFNFNQEAFERTAGFEHWVKDRLAESERIHADETGINIGGKRHWLHCASNDHLTWLAPHEKRGQHALCNAHHLRELQRAWEQDKQAWARRMQRLLCAMRDAVQAAGGSLPPDKADRWRRVYRNALAGRKTRVHHRMKANGRASVVGSNARAPATCWSGCATMRRMSFAFWMTRRSRLPITRANAISACSRCSRKSPVVSAHSRVPGSSVVCAATCRRRGSKT